MEDDFNGGAEAPAESTAAPTPDGPKEGRSLAQIFDDSVKEIEEREGALDELAALEQKEAKAAKEKRAALAKTETEEPVEDEPKPEKAKAKAEPEPKDEDEDDEPAAERDEKGRFKSKGAAEDEDGDEPEDTPDATEDDDEDVGEPPARFAEAGKKAWAKAPKEVRDEITRAISELEKGIKGYQDDFAGLKEENRQAIRANNLRTADVLNKAMDWDRLLSGNILQGLEAMAQAKGYSLHDIAAHVMQQAPNADLSKMERTVAEVRNENAALKEKVATYERHFNDQRQQAVSSEIETFFKEHPDAVAMEGHLAKMISSGLADDLQTAYQAAQRLFGASEPVAVQPPAPVETPAPTRKRDPKAQTQKASLSVSGSPPSGSNPGAKRPPTKSASDAVDRALAELNL